MRISYLEDENYPGQFELWQANCYRSLAGKRGQTALREIEQALLTLPEKRLIAGAIDTPAGDVCAIGAVAKKRRLSRADLGLDEFDSDDYSMEEVGVSLGIPKLVAWKIVEMNDVKLDRRWDPQQSKSVEYSPEERYTAMLAWVQSQLKR